MSKYPLQAELKGLGLYLDPIFGVARTLSDREGKLWIKREDGMPVGAHFEVGAAGNQTGKQVVVYHDLSIHGQEKVNGLREVAQRAGISFRCTLEEDWCRPMLTVERDGVVTRERDRSGAVGYIDQLLGEFQA